MNRITIAQSILDALGNGSYLEIGVNTGSSFIPIKANRKLGVDPSVRLTGRRLAKYAVFSALGIKVERVFEMTSDEFFGSKQKLLSSAGIDVCLVDGLHTYEQAFKDVLNCLDYLNPRGVILLHDCNPSTELMAQPIEGIDELIRQRVPLWDGAWSGDVWKVLVHLRALRGDLTAFVLDCDTGIGVVSRNSRTRCLSLSYSIDDIRAMDYGFLADNRAGLLDLQPSKYFETFLNAHGRGV